MNKPLLLIGLLSLLFLNTSQAAEALDPKLAAAMTDAASKYVKWGRVDELPNIAPELCRTPTLRDYGVASQARLSAEGPHRRKLYYLWATEKQTYLTLKTDTALPVGFTVVKESFTTKPHVEAKKPVVQLGAFSALGNPPAVDTLTLPTGERVQTDKPSGLYVMKKIAATEISGTDRGWIYGTVTPDGKVTSAGRVESCMGCHAQAPYDRLFGLKPSSLF